MVSGESSCHSTGERVDGARLLCAPRCVVLARVSLTLCVTHRSSPSLSASDDPLRTYAKIIKGDIAFPLHFTRSASDLIRALLHPKPTKRLGITSGGAAQIKKHAWFHGFDWRAFESQQLKAPFLLPIQNASDLSNFESYANEPVEVVPYTGDTANPKWDEDF